MVDIALGKAGFEPAHTLLRGAVGKGIRYHPALAFLLQAIVADGVCGVQSLFDVAGFQPVQALLCLVSPDAGQAIGLQLLANQQAVIALHAFTALARGLHLG
ncbi:hypothetical protein D3C77_600440 [compost metagenome]